MSEFSEDRLLSMIRELLPQVELTNELEQLSGGNINFVWRAVGTEKNLIIKHAPPHIATDPDVPLSEERIDFEARVLKKFDQGGSLHKIAQPEIRPPEWYAYDPAHSLLIMEDVGDFQELQTASGSPQKIGKRLGQFIGNLHRNTFQDGELKRNFHNIEIQKVRNQLQYQSAHTYLGMYENELAETVKTRCQSLGNKLMEPGICLVMGDLWPPSIFVGNEYELRLIDWEFVHFGRPLQDVAHFAAHCWMWAHTRLSQDEAEKWKMLWANFWSNYKNTVGDYWEYLFDDEEKRDFYIHLGAEILIRANGAFKKGYLYDLPEEQQHVQQEAISAAAAFILGEKKLWDAAKF